MLVFSFPRSGVVTHRVCGEALFEENEVNHIQKALQQVDLETIALKSNIA